MAKIIKVSSMSAEGRNNRKQNEDGLRDRSKSGERERERERERVRERER